MLFGRNGIRCGNLHNLYTMHLYLKPARHPWGTRVRLDQSAENKAALLGQIFGCFKFGIADIAFEDHGLANAAAITYL